MESFFFGDSGRQLYGVFHSASSASYRDRAVLLLYPVGQEYMRIHRAWRRLADDLASEGFDVLRFDYACTGDSHGEFQTASIEQWVQSTESAYDELLAMSNAGRVDVIGLRLGTVIARFLTQRRRVRRLVLWEPQFDDISFWDQLRTDIERRRPSRANFLSDTALHHNGYIYSNTLRDSLRDGSWQDFASANVDRALIVSTHSAESHERLIEQFDDPAKIDEQRVDGPDDWTVVDSVGGLFLPEPSTSAILGWLVK